jgi:hypothetical protein
MVNVVRPEVAAEIAALFLRWDVDAGDLASDWTGEEHGREIQAGESDGADVCVRSRGATSRLVSRQAEQVAEATRDSC